MYRGHLKSTFVFKHRWICQIHILSDFGHMSELGASSDMPFEIRAVHDVGYPGGDNENAPFGRLPGANCAQSSGVTQVIFLPISPPSEKKKVAGSFSGVLSN